MTKLNTLIAGFALLLSLTSPATPTAHADEPAGFYTAGFVENNVIHLTVNQSGRPGAAGTIQFLLRFRYLNDGMVITPSIVGGDLTTTECNTISCGIVWKVPYNTVNASLDVAISGAVIPSHTFVAGDIAIMSLLPTGETVVELDWTPLHVGQN